MTIKLVEKFEIEKGKSRKGAYLCSYCGRTFVACIGNAARRKADHCGCQPKPKPEKKPIQASEKNRQGTVETPYDPIPDSGIQKEVHHVPRFNHVSKAEIKRVPEYPFWVVLRNGKAIDRISMSSPERKRYKNQARHIAIKDFERKVGIDGLVAVYFHRDDCEGCAAMLPTFEAFALERCDIKFFALKRPRGVHMFELFNLKIYPTVIVYKNGKEHCRNETFRTDSVLLEWLKGIKKDET